MQKKFLVDLILRVISVTMKDEKVKKPRFGLSWDQNLESFVSFSSFSLLLPSLMRITAPVLRPRKTNLFLALSLTKIFKDYKRKKFSILSRCLTL